MAFLVQFTTIAKRHNSTFRPSTFSREYGCVLKEGATITAPILGLDIGITHNPAVLNYAHISEYSRYYFITDWEWKDGLWWAYLKVDVLASFKNEIGASSCYVLRAASDFDNSISDALYPTKPQASYDRQQEDPVWPVDSFNDGTYLIGVLGSDSIAGAVSYYALTPHQMGHLRNALMSDIDWMHGESTEVMEVSDELLKALFNPFQYLASATWFPFSISGETKVIKLGWWESSATGQATSALTRQFSFEFLLKANSKATEQGGGFRYAAPYSSYYMFVPPFGNIEFPADIVASCLEDAGGVVPVADCTAYINVDLVTGSAYMQVRCGSTILAYREGQVGVPVQLGQITQDIAGGAIAAAQGAVTAVKGFFTGAPVSGLLAGAASVYNGMEMATPKPQTMGNNGSITVYMFNPYTESVYHEMVNRTPQETGLPLCDTRTISSLTGYIKTMDADVQILRAFSNEQQAIKAYMNGGFFYE